MKIQCIFLFKFSIDFYFQRISTKLTSEIVKLHGNRYHQHHEKLLSNESPDACKWRLINSMTIVHLSIRRATSVGRDLSLMFQLYDWMHMERRFVKRKRVSRDLRNHRWNSNDFTNPQGYWRKDWISTFVSHVWAEKNRPWIGSKVRVGISKFVDVQTVFWLE